MKDQLLVLKIVSYQEAESIIRSIRQAVFQVEQQVDPELDFDGLDALAVQVIAYWGGEPIGTARIRYLNEQLAKIERVAVLSSHRGKGIGKALVREAIAFLDSQNVPEIKLNSQLHAKDFYQKLGFIQKGEEFLEAGIPHIEMRRSR